MLGDDTKDIGIQIGKRWREENQRRHAKRRNLALRRILGRMNTKLDMTAADRLRVVLRK